MKIHALAASALSLCALLATGSAAATNLFDPTVSSTSAIDGSSVRLDGTLNDTNANPQPWTAEFYAQTGECVRFFVPSTTFDAKITVIAPNGLVYRDDDSGGQNRPLVRIASAPQQGWYTVQVAHYSGQPMNANFTLLYGRYVNGNPNCALATPPTISAMEEPAKVSVEPAPARRHDAP